MGLVYLQKGDTPKAAELFAKGLNLTPKKGKLYFKTAMAFLKKS
jgi:Tfp pilus assembly protein PilF